VDGSVRVEGEDRAGVERLVRYCARGPLALERLHAIDGQEALASPQARLLYRLAEPDLQGRTELVLSPPELLERLAKLIPPPRVHRHRYHGVLAPHARLRPPVVAIGREGPDSEDAARPGCSLLRSQAQSKTPHGATGAFSVCREPRARETPPKRRLRHDRNLTRLCPAGEGVVENPG
jgi:hypothetical protein